MALITVAELEARYGTVDETKAAAHIDDVSAEVVDYVTILDTDADDPITPGGWDSTSVPDAIKGVVARVVNRALTNPQARTSEQYADGGWQAATAASGGTLGPKDRRIIRRAVQRLGTATVGLTGDLPLTPIRLQEDDLVL